MERNNARFGKLFFWLSAFSALLVLTEIVLQAFGKSICPTVGCRIVAEHVRYGDLSILLIGITTFGLLAVLAAPRGIAARAFAGRAIDAVLITALACEGFFTGYQAFVVRTPCFFCLVIFGLIVLLALVRLASGAAAPIAGFLALGAVFSLFYLVPPAVAPPALPQDGRLILFYSKGCSHCAEVIRELDSQKLSVTHVQVDAYAGALKSVGIEHVPTLLVNDPFQKLFLTGKEEIDRYLNACTAAERPQAASAHRSVRSSAPVVDQTATLDLFAKPDLLSSPAATAEEEGMCREDAVCK